MKEVLVASGGKKRKLTMKTRTGSSLGRKSQLRYAVNAVVAVFPVNFHSFGFASLEKPPPPLFTILSTVFGDTENRLSNKKNLTTHPVFLNVTANHFDDQKTCANRIWGDN